MNVLVTGAGGYLGGLMVRAHAARGDTVHAFARQASDVPAIESVTAYAVDLAQRGSVPAAPFINVDVVYHCAAELAREPLMRAVNVEGTRALLAHARGNIGHWVQVSSLSVYGNPRAGVIGEDSPAAPRSLYARTKLEADELVAQTANSAFSHTIVRPAALIGRHMRSGSLRALIEAVARGRFFFIGEPGAIGNYLVEDNAVAALLLCATRPAARGRTYNVCQNCTIEHMVSAIASEIGGAREPLRVPRTLARIVAQVGRVLPDFPATPRRVHALTSRVEYRTDRIERELGYAHGRSVQDALRELAQAWKNERR